MAQTPFTLSRATEDDLDEIMNLEYECFDDWIRRIFMGCRSRDDLPKYKQGHLRRMQTDPNDVWVKVVDKGSGRIIAASNWKVYVNGQTGGGAHEEPSENLQGEELEKSKAIMEKMNAAKAKSNPGPFIHLHICFTHAEYRRRGAGGLMMKWGCDLMDLLQLPGWIEASDEGNFLYKTFGFYDFEKIEGDLGGTNMKRDPRPSYFEGGK